MRKFERSKKNKIKTKSLYLVYWLKNQKFFILTHMKSNVDLTMFSLSLDSRAQQEIQEWESRGVFEKNIILGNRIVLRIVGFYSAHRTAPGTAVLHSDVYKLKHGALKRPDGGATFELHEKLTFIKTYWIHQAKTTWCDINPWNTQETRKMVPSEKKKEQ